MSSSTNLNLPYLAAGQAQKHVTVNEAMRVLDTLIQLAVLTRGLATPPASPAEGSAYIVAGGATGVWSGHGGKIAAWRDGGWVIHVPREGWLAWVRDEDKLYAYSGTDWTVIVSVGGSVPTLGVNASADNVNRLAVSSAASLFNHEGAGHQIKINKSADGDTASVMFQKGFSGRAEIGLCGSNALSFKASLDGSAWTTGMTITGQGMIGIGTTSPTQQLDVAGAALVRDRMIVGTGQQNFYIGEGRLELCSDTVGPYFDWKTASAQDFLWRMIVNGANFEIAAAEGATVRYPLRLSQKGAIMLQDNWVGTSGQVLTTQGDTNLSARWRSISELRFSNHAKAALPSASGLGAGAVIYVTDEAGGPVLAFSDGSAWRRVTDRAVVS